jgi:hypothetical protein
MSSLLTAPVRLLVALAICAAGAMTAVAQQAPPALRGNSSSDDQQMLEYVKAGTGTRLSGLVMHDDAAREYAYGPAQGLSDTRVGTLSQAMYDMAKQQNWTIISMQNGWKRIFPFEG